MPIKPTKNLYGLFQSPQFEKTLLMGYQRPLTLKETDEEPKQETVLRLDELSNIEKAISDHGGRCA